MKVGDVFFTTSGRVGRINSEFAYGDGYNFLGAIWDGTRWLAERFTAQGVAVSTANSAAEELERWQTFFQFSFKYNPAEHSWEGKGTHISNAALSVAIIKYESPERILLELNKAAEEKVLELLKPLGYPSKTEDAG